jgi:diguanylate cyclase (GGDEF)-like protein
MSAAKHAILAVTADTPTVAVLKNLLDSGQTLLATASPVEAINHAQGEEPGLVLLDGRLPGLDVGEFCSRLKVDPRTSGIPVLLLAVTEEAAEAGLKRGVNDYFVLPLRPLAAKTRLRNYLDLGRCIEALRRFSLIDAVTGIANRRRFDEFLTLEWRRNLRNHSPLSIVLMDLDHFRTYLERYGTTASDACLKRIATAFTDATQRPGDLMACYSKGGFACVLPETDTLGAVSVAERMRAELATLAIPHEGSATASILTMSVGTATRVPVAEADPEDLVAMAEQTLRDAKRAGRNRVIFAG